ncbi:T9SS type A sorting domain-containing protein, partial [Xanthovirga aplysinae]|uniref:T9SS type A sorting domain-containing protein n=1 Tax=Xanthovirga aplysinae TaxID=2529853 RepID=UPI0012BD09FF
QERGDLISYELLADWSEEEAEDYVSDIVNDLASAELGFNLPEFIIDLVTQINRPIEIYKVNYQTEDFHGNPILASGAVLFPKVDCSLPMLTYNHGTVFDRDMVPSRMSGAQGIEFAYPVVFAGGGYMVVAPDYIGLGDGPGFHPYVDSKTGAAATIDNMRAARELSNILGKELNEEVFLTGYSQGGHASIATLKEIQEYYSDEFHVKYAAPGSGPYDLSGTEFDFIMYNPEYPTREYILYIIATCQQNYGNLYTDISEVLKPEYVDLYNTHILGQTGEVDWVPLPWTELFLPGVYEEIRDNKDNPLRQCLSLSDNYNWQNQYPTEYYYTTADEQVDYECSLLAKEAQRDQFPWWQFWEIAKLQSTDIGLFGLLPHGEASITTILGAREDFNQRSSRCLPIASNIIRSMEKGGSVKLSDMNIRMRSTAFETEIKWQDENSKVEKIEIYDMDNNKIKQFDNLQNESENLSISKKGLKPGMYRLSLTDREENKYEDLLIIKELDYLKHEQYDPFVNNPMIKSTALDLSLLDEYVDQVIIYDSEGNKQQQYDNVGDTDALTIERNGLKRGSYTVEVRTSSSSYNLLLEVGTPDKLGYFQVNPNPIVSGQAKIDLNQFGDDIASIKILAMDGRTIKVFEQPREGASEFIFYRGNLKTGMYFIEVITESNDQHLAKILVK